MNCTDVQIRPFDPVAEKVTATLKTAGQQGWELATAYGVTYCFKRPLR